MAKLIWQCMRLHSDLDFSYCCTGGKAVRTLPLCRSQHADRMRLTQIFRNNFLPSYPRQHKIATAGPKSLHAIYAVGPTSSILTHGAQVCLQSVRRRPARITQELLWNPLVQHPNQACQIQSRFQAQSQIQNDILGRYIKRRTSSSWITWKFFNVKKCKNV
jgi:hypothetical protein